MRLFFESIDEWYERKMNEVFENRFEADKFYKGYEDEYYDQLSNKHAEQSIREHEEYLQKECEKEKFK